VSENLLAVSLLDGVDVSPLSEPLELAGLPLQNHYAMAPMTRQFAIDGVPGEDVVAYYTRRAPSLGLIITEGVYIEEPSAGTSANVPHIYGEAALDGWKAVIESVHGLGAKIIPQLWHLGAARQAGAPPVAEAPVVSPSGIDGQGNIVGDPLSKAQMANIAQAFAQAALNAQKTGFDGVEIHGAHGYLLDQFMWHVTNRRSDEYGGPIENRVRFPAEVVAAIRKAVGPDYPIVFRFSQWKGGAYDARLAGDPRELEAYLLPLAEAGVDIFHISTRRFPVAEFPGASLSLAGWVKQLTGKPTIAVGSVGVPYAFHDENGPQADNLSLARVMEAYTRGEFDVLAVGRALLADPYFVVKLSDGIPEAINLYTKTAEEVLY
jgi:2,4-dienoyl-CoA reductase-like NADH-dependent reductase (Old Yellow Enzyme family)